MNNIDELDISSDFSGGPVIKNTACKAGNMGLMPVGELRSHMLWGN